MSLISAGSISLDSTFKLCWIIDFKGREGNEKFKNGGVGMLANVRRWFQTVAIDACLFFNFAVIFYTIYFRFPT